MSHHIDHTYNNNTAVTSVVTKALDAETETKTEAAGFETEAKTEAVASETEAKTEAVYLKTEAEAQGSWPILLTVLSSMQLRKIKLNHRYMMFMPEGYEPQLYYMQT